MRPPASDRPRAPFRLAERSAAVLAAIVGLIVLVATDQILPPTSDRQAELRFWLAARATGIVAFLLLTLQIVFGLVLSHPHNKTTWKLSKRVFPWHDHLWVFVMAFLAAHIVSLVADPKSGVDLLGALVPGMSEYRDAAVALGTLATYAFLVTAVTARWTKLLPAGAWLSLHRAPAVAVIARSAAAHDELAATVDDAAQRYRSLAARYDALGGSIDAYESTLDELVARTDAITESVGSLPTRIQLPSAPSIPAAAPRSQPATDASTGASG